MFTLTSQHPVANAQQVGNVFLRPPERKIQIVDRPLGCLARLERLPLRGEPLPELQLVGDFSVRIQLLEGRDSLAEPARRG